HTVPAFIDDPKNGRVLVNPTIVDCTHEYEDYKPDIDLILDHDDLGSGVTFVPDTARPVMATANLSRAITGTKTDEISEHPYPFGTDTFAWDPAGFRNLLAKRGYWINTDAKKY